MMRDLKFDETDCIDWIDVNYQNCSFTNTDLWGTMICADFVSCNFVNHKMDEGYFEGCKIKDTKFQNCDHKMALGL